MSDPSPNGLSAELSRGGGGDLEDEPLVEPSLQAGTLGGAFGRVLFRRFFRTCSEAARGNLNPSRRVVRVAAGAIPVGGDHQNSTPTPPRRSSASSAHPRLLANDETSRRSVAAKPYVLCQHLTSLVEALTLRHANSEHNIMLQRACSNWSQHGYRGNYQIS